MTEKKPKGSAGKRQVSARNVADKVAKFERRRAQAMQRIEELQVKLGKVDQELKAYLRDVIECV